MSTDQAMSSSSRQDIESASPASTTVDQLQERLARVEARVWGHRRGLGGRQYRSEGAWGHLRRISAKLAEVTKRVGETTALHLLQKELLSATGLGAAPHTFSLGSAEKQNIVLARENELNGMASQLRRIHELSMFISGPFLEDDSGDLVTRLQAAQVQMIETEQQALVVSRELEELIRAYGQMVSLISEKCVEWDEALAACEDRLGICP